MNFKFNIHPWFVINLSIYIIIHLSRSRYHLVEKEHDSGEGSHTSSLGSEDRAPAAMARAITVHTDSMKVMYFA